MAAIPIIGQAPPKSADPMALPLNVIVQQMEQAGASFAPIECRHNEPPHALLFVVYIARGPMAIEVSAAMKRMVEYLKTNEEFQRREAEFLSRKIQVVGAGNDKALKGETS